MNIRSNFEVRSILVAVVVLIAIVGIMPAYSAVPNTVMFQGYLTDTNGVPLTGSHNMTFTIYDASSSGATIWTSTVSSAAVTNGVVNVELGGSGQTALPAGAFSTGDRYLGVAIDGGAEMTPRQKFTSVGFAINSHLLDGNPASSFAGVFHYHNDDYVSLSGAYADPSWLTSLAASKVSGNISGNAANVTGTVALANGGTGATTAAAARSSLGAVNIAGDTMTGTLAVPSLTSNGNITLSGNLELPDASTTAGIIQLNGTRYMHNGYGLVSNNFFAGYNTGTLNTGNNGNTATGSQALRSITSGSHNTASGFNSLVTNVSGANNSAFGYQALYSNNTNGSNTAVGHQALYTNTGSNNTALGAQAGYNQTTGSNNIYIGYNVTGTAAESNVTRIGSGQTQTYIAGTVTATGFVGDGSLLNNVSASSVSNGLYSTGAYADPTWLTSIAGSKIGGNITGNAANVTGVVAAANGGTGQSSYATGDLLYASSASALSRLGDVATGSALISGGIGAAPSWGKVGLTTHVSGILPVANGGTGSATQNFVALNGNAGPITLGTTDTSSLTLVVNNTQAFRIVPDATSPSIIAGFSGNTVDSGVIGATISGGGYSSQSNWVTDNYGTIGGGAANQAGDGTAGVSSAQFATVAGGNQNTATGPASTIGGGTTNLASGNVSTIGGGYRNIASGTSSTVPGGEWNEANGNDSFAAGYKARANHNNTFVWSGSDAGTSYFDSTNSYQFLIKAVNGVGINKNNPATALDVNGTITGDSYKYSVPKTFYYNLHPSSYVNSNAYPNCSWLLTNAYSRPDTFNACHITAFSPVHLPEGATVTEFMCRYYDADATNDVTVGAQLYRTPNSSLTSDTMASFSTTSSGSSGWQSTTAGTPINNPIDNQLYSYTAFLDWSVPNFGAMYFGGCRIAYTMTEIRP